MPSMTATMAIAVARSFMPASWLRVPGLGRDRFEIAEELAVGGEDEGGIGAGERGLISEERAIEGKEFLVPRHRFGIDANALRIAIAAEDLRLLLRIGPDLDHLAIGLGFDF